MAVNLDLIVAFSFLIGLVVIFMGILLIGKSAGKFKRATILLTTSIIVYTLGIGINILNILGVIDLPNKIFLNNLTDLGVVLFLFFSMFSLLTMLRESTPRKNRKKK